MKSMCSHFTRRTRRGGQRRCEGSQVRRPTADALVYFVKTSSLEFRGATALDTNVQPLPAWVCGGDFEVVGHLELDVVDIT